ncbi:DMT family transporter [Liquorilactobacillus uvarum]|uniref:Integral membrane protein n=1 Tax=Liquorilactobacillus uvarum DSM 19971 TaxID=1423812 RepID=A0A0R1Q7N3_9LACO|nr:DMT family transporter [Liquorilactobacillus uvarum]KRL38210.1 hypothetical protein FD20_GL002163 [Liquorilactobacillus uvarum DSM 19971]
MLPLILGVSVGIILPMQTAVNSRLRTVVNSAFISSMISFTIGTLFLVISTFATTGSLFVSKTLLVNQPWWIWIGGFLGVIYLTGNIILFPHLGSVQTVIMPVLGQIIMSMLIDNYGWFFSPASPLTVIRICGALLVFAGVFSAVALPGLLQTSKLKSVSAKAQPTTSSWLWRIVGVLTGALSAVQTAINGHLSVVVHSAVKAALISFLVGTVALWLIVLLKERKVLFNNFHIKATVWWNWIGGIMGALFVCTNAYLVPIIGTGMVVVILLIGTIIGSLLVDQFGLFASQKNPVNLLQLLGVFIMVIGVGMIKLL